MKSEELIKDARKVLDDISRCNYGSAEHNTRRLLDDVILEDKKQKQRIDEMGEALEKEPECGYVEQFLMAVKLADGRLAYLNRVLKVAKEPEFD